MSHIKNSQLCVRRGGSSGLADALVVETTLNPSGLLHNQIILRVDKFGFSANNVTYGLLGEHPHFKYFDFFPAPRTSETSSDTHAVIPVWGFGTVVSSRHAAVKIGRRVYGYLGMSRYVVLQLDEKVSAYSANVSLNGMPADRRPYKQLTFTDTDVLYRASREDEMMLYLPLYWTSYWMEDNINERKHDVSTILISSASSKTAFIVAYRLLLRRKEHLAQKLSTPRVIGLTSASNIQFTRSLGFYDDVLRYDQVSQAKSFTDGGRTLYIDVSGNTSLNETVHKIVDPALSISLGMTSVEGSDAANLRPSRGDTTREAFFMPEWFAVRLKQLGGRAVKEMQITAWAQLMDDCASWVTMDQYRGAEEVLAAYQKTLKNSVAPDRGQVFSLWNSTDERQSKL